MIKSAEEFVRLRSSSKYEEYIKAAHDSASERVWLEVIEKYPNYKCWVAQNKTVPLSILRILAQDKNREVRGMVAMKRKAGEELLTFLSRDLDVGVRANVLNNPKVTLTVLEILKNDSDNEIADKAKEKILRLKKKR